MSLTVADCLKLPSLRNCKVLAGEKGLNHIVNNVSVLEIYDVSLFDLSLTVNDSDLTLVSFEAIADDPELQCRHIEHMHNMGDAAVIIYYVGIFLKEIHPSLIETADRLGFPLIIMPENRMDCFYREVLRDVYEAIFYARSKENDFINNSVALISRLPESKKTLPNLLRLISDSLKCTVLLSDTAMNNLCLSKWPSSNDITADEILRLYESACSKDQYQAETIWQGRPLHIFHLPLTVPEYRNFSVYAADESAALTAEDMHNIIELLEIFSKLWKLDRSNILENSLIPAILDGDSEKMYQIADNLSIDIQSINTAFFLRPVFCDADDRTKLQLRRDMVRSIKECSRDLGKTVLVDTYGSLIVFFLMYSPAANADREYLQEIMERIDRLCSSYTISFFPCDTRAEDVHKTYLLYSGAIAAATGIFPKKKLFSYGDILFARQCEAYCREKGEVLRICRNILAPVFSESDGDILLETLCVYFLDTDCSVKTTAERLYVHRNTIQYRLSKICAITNFSTDDLLSSNMMHLSAACFRLCPSLFQDLQP